MKSVIAISQSVFSWRRLVEDQLYGGVKIQKTKLKTFVESFNTFNNELQLRAINLTIQPISR